MPTLADLKARVIVETNRDDMGSGDDLEGTLASCIERACEFYAGENFWFIAGNGTATTVSGRDYVTCPYAVRLPHTVSYDDQPLTKASLSDIQHLDNTNGQPSHWAPNGNRIQLWPIPDGAYSLSVFGEAQVDAPTNDTDETIWTNEAYDLIAARTRFLLYRDVLRDTEGMNLAGQAEDEVLTKLKRETRQRNRVPLRPQGDEPWLAARTFNINRG